MFVVRVCVCVVVVQGRERERARERALFMHVGDQHLCERQVFSEFLLCGLTGCVEVKRGSFIKMSSFHVDTKLS